MLKKITGYFTGTAAVILIGVVVFLAACAFPWLLLWSLNTLTGNNVEFDFWTWLAAFVFLLLIRADLD